MKKLLALLLILTITCLAMFSCWNSGNENEGGGEGETEGESGNGGEGGSIDEDLDDDTLDNIDSDAWTPVE